MDIKSSVHNSNYTAGVKRLLIGSLALLSACASIISGTTKTVMLSSTPTGATFQIADESGKPIHRGVTPATVSLERGEGYFSGHDYSIDFAYPGYQSNTVPLESTLNGWYAGNILFGGLIGLLIVDPATGAMWSFPSELSTTLQPADKRQ